MKRESYDLWGGRGGGEGEQNGALQLLDMGREVGSQNRNETMHARICYSAVPLEQNSITKYPI